MPSLLLRQHEQGYAFGFEPLDFLGGDEDRGAPVNRMDHGLGLEVPAGDEVGPAADAWGIRLADAVCGCAWRRNC